ncbi:5-formyltetrahydrofolate cyclo-ligase [Candidatus Peregrinibacteria bacterium]|nr:5-formyltetrahydrofolate cyclo-ligase [Candidatus Peregrinibacteria bacterium]
MDPRETKSRMRLAIKERFSRLSAKDRSSESRSLCRRILESLPQGPIALCAYYPLSDEADILPLFGELQKRSSRIFMPAHDGGKLTFRAMTAIENIAIGEFGIPEPLRSAEELKPDDLAIALVPGRAFDCNGRRLGRGNGGYDAWIRRQRRENPQAQFWGVALECQIVQEIPVEAHDERMDALITARGLKKCMDKK